MPNSSPLKYHKFPAIQPKTTILYIRISPIIYIESNILQRFSQCISPHFGRSAHPCPGTSPSPQSLVSQPGKRLTSQQKKRECRRSSEKKPRRHRFYVLPPQTMAFQYFSPTFTDMSLVFLLIAQPARISFANEPIITYRICSIEDAFHSLRSIGEIVHLATTKA